MNSERRPDLRRTYLEKVRHSGKPSPGPLVHHRGATFDRIIFEWVRDIEKAIEAIGKALAITSVMTERDWNKDNHEYAATCKWIQSGLDSFQQWNLESGDSATTIVNLPWKNLRVFRNNLTHSFQDTPPEEVKQVAEETLPSLKLLLNLINIGRYPTPKGDPYLIPVPELEYLRRELSPLTIGEGTQLGDVGTALIYIGYDEKYYPRHINLCGYQEDGVLWNATPYNDQGEPPESIIIPIKTEKTGIWTPPRRHNW